MSEPKPTRKHYRRPQPIATLGEALVHCQDTAALSGGALHVTVRTDALWLLILAVGKDVDAVDAARRLIMDQP